MVARCGLSSGVFDLGELELDLVPVLQIVRLPSYIARESKVVVKATPTDILRGVFASKHSGDHQTKTLADLELSIDFNHLAYNPGHLPISLGLGICENRFQFGRSSGDVSAEMRKVLDAVPWPPGYRYTTGGSTKNMQESFSYAIGALALAVVFIYMILASQFKSFLQPLALMTALPLTLIGVVLALMMFRSTLSMFSVIGVIMLMGLVTKNAILLVDFANHARKAGASVPEALLQAGLIRMRPIVMTTAAMVFGMLPMALALNDGGEIQAPMGRAIIGGVITSSLLTLVVVPVVYCYMDDLAQWLRRKAGLAPARQGHDTPAA